MVSTLKCWKTSVQLSNSRPCVQKSQLHWTSPFHWISLQTLTFLLWRQSQWRIEKNRYVTRFIWYIFNIIANSTWKSEINDHKLHLLFKLKLLYFMAAIIRMKQVSEDWISTVRAVEKQWHWDDLINCEATSESRQQSGKSPECHTVFWKHQSNSFVTQCVI
jgi:hypothetical protein